MKISKIIIIFILLFNCIACVSTINSKKDYIEPILISQTNINYDYIIIKKDNIKNPGLVKTLFELNREIDKKGKLMGADAAIFVRYYINMGTNSYNSADVTFVRIKIKK